MDDGLFLQLSNNIFFNFVYDVAKFFIGYLLARWLYDGVYKNYKYGGWVLVVVHSENKGSDATLARRTMTPAWAEKVLKDENEFSVYAKGVVSPYTYLNIDICSKQAKEQGLLKVEPKIKTITINLAHNPAAEKLTHGEAKRV